MESLRSEATTTISGVVIGTKATMALAPFDGKVTRFFTSLVLPIDETRSGQCDRCGACCKFFVTCPFLRYVDGDEKQPACKIYKVRPLQCRKYPRTKAEQIHQPCGYRFGGEAH